MGRISPIFKDIKHIGTSLCLPMHQNDKAALYNYSVNFATFFILSNSLLISNTENHFLN